MVSIIIPILNEEDNLPRLFENVAKLKLMPQQVILVDGGSVDNSVGMAQSFIEKVELDNHSLIDWQMVQSTAGRAIQMNTGAALATGKVLLFLHADTQLPVTAINDIFLAMQKADNNYKWGRFDVQLDSREPMLRLVSQMMNWRSKLTGIATGDQAIFINKSLFEQIGGYPKQPLMEDIELCKLLKRIAKRPACLSSKVITSARRWQQHGTWRTILLMWHLRFDYWRGVSADNIKRRYYKR